MSFIHSEQPIIVSPDKRYVMVYPIGKFFQQWKNKSLLNLHHIPFKERWDGSWYTWTPHGWELIENIIEKSASIPELNNVRIIENRHNSIICLDTTKFLHKEYHKMKDHCYFVKQELERILVDDCALEIFSYLPPVISVQKFMGNKIYLPKYPQNALMYARCKIPNILWEGLESFCDHCCQKSAKKTQEPINKYYTCDTCRMREDMRYVSQYAICPSCYDKVHVKQIEDPLPVRMVQGNPLRDIDHPEEDFSDQYWDDLFDPVYEEKVIHSKDHEMTFIEELSPLDLLNWRKIDELKKRFKALDPGGGGGPYSWGLLKLEKFYSVLFMLMLAEKLGYNHAYMVLTNWDASWIHLWGNKELARYYIGIDHEADVRELSEEERNTLNEDVVARWDHYIQNYKVDKKFKVHQMKVNVAQTCFFYSIFGEDDYDPSSHSPELHYLMDNNKFYKLKTQSGFWQGGCGHFVLVN